MNNDINSTFRGLGGMVLEIAVFNIQSAISAAEAGASRLELCENPAAFIPPPKLRTQLKFELGNAKSFTENYFKTEWLYVAEQNQLGEFETVTPAFNLFAAGAGTTVKCKRTAFIISVNVNNIFNEVYTEHLSRLKPLHLYNTGRSINVNLKIPISLNKKTK